MKKIVLFLLMIITMLCTSCGDSTTTQAPIEDNKIVRYNDVAIQTAPKIAGAIEILVIAKEDNSKIYYVVVPHDSAIPTAAEIKAGGSYQGVTPAAKGNGQGMIYSNIIDLSHRTEYDVHVVLELDNKFSEVYSTNVITFNDADVVDKGDGSIENPFRIYTAEDLQAVASNADLLSMHYSLEADIDLAPIYNEETESFTPIGWQTGALKAFNGTFSGNGHKIKNLYIRRETESTGLFGQVGPEGVVRDVIIENPDIQSTGQRLGGVVGYNKGTVMNCAVIGGKIASVKTNQSKAGGVVGDLYEFGIISGCYSKTTIEASGQNAGGIAGSCDAPTGSKEALIVRDCYSFSTINSTHKYVGGIVGYFRCGEINSCYYSGNVTGLEGVGGILGMAQQRKDSPIIPVVKNCAVINSKVVSTAASTTISSGLVIGNKSTSNLGVTVSNLYYYNTTVESVKKSTSDGAQLFDIANFSNADWLLNCMDINFNAQRWYIEENMNRPILKWVKDLDNGKWEE